MIALEMRNLAGVKFSMPARRELDTPLPCIVFYHGFTSSSWSTAILPWRWQRRGFG
jgi:hypothetical protein